MRLGRRLACMLVGAIVAIVACLASSAVEAHAGHHHPPPTAVAMDANAAKLHEAAAPTTIAGTSMAADVVLSEAGPARLAPIKSCNGVCCGNAGMVCCAHGLPPEAPGASVARAAARRTAIPNDLARPGVDPEALPEPPRPFA